MSTSFKQRSYISHTLKVNINLYPELKEMFPLQIRDSVNVTYQDLEAKVSKLDPVAVSDVISFLKDDKIVSGFRQLDYLIKQ